jgi:intracellular septation protein A
MTDLIGIQPNPSAAAVPRAIPPRLARNLAVDVALPWITVQLLERAWDVPIVLAFAAAVVFPAASILFSWRRHRRADFIGLAVFAAILSGIAIALFTNDVRFTMLKAAPVFGLFDLACLLATVTGLLLWTTR